MSNNAEIIKRLEELAYFLRCRKAVINSKIQKIDDAIKEYGGDETKKENEKLLLVLADIIFFLKCEKEVFEKATAGGPG